MRDLQEQFQFANLRTTTRHPGPPTEQTPASSSVITTGRGCLRVIRGRAGKAHSSEPAHSHEARRIAGKVTKTSGFVQRRRAYLIVRVYAAWNRELGCGIALCSDKLRQSGGLANATREAGVDEKTQGQGHARAGRGRLVGACEWRVCSGAGGGYVRAKFRGELPSLAW
jgi:hypothetical protein